MHLRTFSHVSFAFEPFSSIYLLGFFSHSLFFYYPNFTKFPPAANRSINTRRMLRNWSWLSVLNLVGVWRMGVKCESEGWQHESDIANFKHYTLNMLSPIFTFEMPFPSAYHYIFMFHFHMLLLLFFYLPFQVK